jgi:hypothetical protein
MAMLLVATALALGGKKSKQQVLEIASWHWPCEGWGEGCVFVVTERVQTTDMYRLAGVMLIVNAIDDGSGHYGNRAHLDLEVRCVESHLSDEYGRTRDFGCLPETCDAAANDWAAHRGQVAMLMVDGLVLDLPTLEVHPGYRGVQDRLITYAVGSMLKIGAEAWTPWHTLDAIVRSRAVRIRMCDDPSYDVTLPAADLERLRTVVQGMMPHASTTPDRDSRRDMFGGFSESPWWDWW